MARGRGRSPIALPGLAQHPHLQGDSMDNVQGVNDIAQRLAHFPAMGISHDGMKVDL